MNSQQSIKSRRLTRLEWVRRSASVSDLPITCDPNWAQAIEATSGLRATPFAVRIDGRELLVVGYKNFDWGWPPVLTLSPHGLSCAVTGSPSEAFLACNAILSNPVQYRSAKFNLPVWCTFVPADLKTEQCRSEVAWDSHLTHVLSLDRTWDRLFTEQFRSTTRRCIRRSQEAGVKIVLSRNPTDVEAYYAIHLQLADMKGNYNEILPLKLLKLLVQNCERCEFAGAWLNGRLVAGGLFFNDGPDTMYWHGASDRTVIAVHPTYALFATMIQRSLEKKKRAFNFGGSAGISSLERFKEGWGCKQEFVLTGTVQHRMVLAAKRIFRFGRAN